MRLGERSLVSYLERIHATAGAKQRGSGADCKAGSMGSWRQRTRMSNSRGPSQAPIGRLPKILDRIAEELRKTDHHAGAVIDPVQNERDLLLTEPRLLHGSSSLRLPGTLREKSHFKRSCLLEACQ